jgi:DNA repair protein RecN (Recombination protein N)
MLKQLSIKNYAIIDFLEIDFKSGFSVLTGETGSGKSIILGALHLLMGNRADIKSVLNLEKKCIIEGVFSIGNYHLKDFFESNDLDYEPGETYIRREISKHGKTRAFINDTPVSLSILKSLSFFLIDIHSQHQTLLLNSSNVQLSLIDSLAQSSVQSHTKLLKEYQVGYSELKSLEKELNIALNDGEESKTQLDYLSFLHKEIEEASLLPDEKEQLEDLVRVSENQDEVNQVLQKINYILESNHTSLPVVSQLLDLVKDLDKISNYSEQYAAIASRLNSSVIELSDIAKESEILLSEVQSHKNDIEFTKDRLNLINQLEQKHRALNFQDLLVKFEAISNKLLSYSTIEKTVDKLEKSIKSLQEDLFKIAKKISSNRKLVKQKTEKFIVSKLIDLGIKNGRFEVLFSQKNELQENGNDQVSFMFSANKGVSLQEMSQVASGGESSRLMLAVKALVAKHLQLPCLVLDEIDTGVSGEIASKIGSILSEMSKQTQLIVISHLPQVASKASTHYKVEKLDINEKTQTNIRLLTAEQRTIELAKMLSGEHVSKAALENAKALLTNQ